MRSFLLLYDTPSGGAAGPVPYKYYRIAVTVWNDASWMGAGEIAFYDDLGNLGNVGIGNGQLDVHGTSGTASASNATSAPASDAADANATTTRWLTLSGATWWKFTFTTTPTNPVLGYTYWSANSATRSPNTFTLEGSDNDTDWTVLDSRSGQTWTLSFQPHDYTIGA